MIDLNLAADAPARFFRAGMGDTLAKYIESTFSARGDELGGALDHMSAIGVSLSSTCCDPILKFGRQALTEVERHEAGPGDGNVRQKRHPFGGTGFADGR